MAWIFLVGAILLEVAGTLALRMAATGPRRWFVAVGLGYVGAFTLLALALAGGIGLGVAYGIWAAVGVALTAVLSRVLFGEPLTWLMGLGIVLIMAFVVSTRSGEHIPSVDYRPDIDVLREYADLTYAEIADIQGVPENTVRSRIARARRGLVRLLGEAESQAQ